jgi:hypothetical protein
MDDVVHETIHDAITIEGDVWAFVGDEDNPSLVPYASVADVYADDADADIDVDDDDVEDSGTVPSTGRKKKGVVPFPPQQASFCFADRQFLLCGNENDPAAAVPTSLEVAQSITILDADGKETYSVLVKLLTVPHLRRLSKQFGIKGYGSKMKYEIRQLLAAKKSSYDRYNIDALATPVNSSSADNTKNIVRVINGVFHPDNFESFLTLNNRKDRSDFEYGNGANNVNFWTIVADCVNDATNTDLDTFRLLDNNPEYNTYKVKRWNKYK